MKTMLPILLVALLTGCANATRPIACSWMERPEIREFRGADAFARISGEKRRDCYALHYAQLFANYGGNVDFELTRQSIVLDDSNIGILYSPEAVPKPMYRRGSHPLLEEFLKGVRDGADSEQAVALAIMRRCRDLHKRDNGRKWEEWIFGGTEEQFIERGERLCESMGRLFVALCEIEGIPARRIAHIVGGHYTAEAFVDGHWMYVDPRFGIWFQKPDGKGASLQELLDNPELVERQPPSVKSDVVAYADWATRADRCKRIYFSKVEMNCFEYYSLADADKYHYATFTYEQAVKNGLLHYNQFYRTLIQELTPKP